MTSNKPPYTTLFNSFKRNIRTLTASLEEKDFSSFDSLAAFKSHQAENRKLNQLLYSQINSYLNYIDEINMWFSNDVDLSTLIAKNREAGKGDSYISEAYKIFKLTGVTPLYSKPLISEYLDRVSINSGLPFADEKILNSSEWIRKEVSDEVDQFIDCEFSVLIANLVLFLEFAARYAKKKAAWKKLAVNNAEVAAENNGGDDVTGYKAAIDWLNSFIETKAGLAKLRAKVWETLTSGHSVEFLDYSRRATEPPSRRAAVNKVYVSIKLC